MDYDAFQSSIKHATCPFSNQPHLAAIWYDAKGDWDRAHEIVQSLPDGPAEAGAARIHAYLHRKEGDLWNSRYWYQRAGSDLPDGLSLQEEWELLVKEHLGIGNTSQHPDEAAS